jgi:hypothetical protein
MNALLNATPHVNGGQPPVNGRGLARRRLSLDEQVKLAADLATGKRPFMPSMAQACMLVDVPQRAVAAELRARAAELRARAARKNGQPPKDLAAAIVAAWDSASEEARREAFRRIGPATVWDTLVAVID